MVAGCGAAEGPGDGGGDPSQNMAPGRLPVQKQTHAKARRQVVSRNSGNINAASPDALFTVT
jgi:hypothetical protein